MEPDGLSNTVIAIIAAAALGGLLVGWLLGRQSSAGQSRSKNLERSLREAEQKLSDYQEEVQSHFKGTAEAFEQVNASYRNLQDKLVEGATVLCTDSPRHPLLEPMGATSSIAVANSTGAEDASSEERSTLEPPRDYAPKKDPNEKGVLTEDFGLEKPGAGLT